MDALEENTIKGENIVFAKEVDGERYTQYWEECPHEVIENYVGKTASVLRRPAKGSGAGSANKNNDDTSDNTKKRGRDEESDDDEESNDDEESVSYIFETKVKKKN